MLKFGGNLGIEIQAVNLLIALFSRSRCLLPRIQDGEAPLFRIRGFVYFNTCARIRHADMLFLTEFRVVNLSFT